VAQLLTRDFTVATFVVHEGRVLLLHHRKLRMWLPPGGHVEPNELPDDAAVREVWEEAGVRCALVGEPGLAVDYPRQLVRPAGIQLENIGTDHEHVDLIYFAKPLDGAVEPRGNGEGDGVGWYPLEALADLGAPADVRQWAERAAAAVGG
jgi:8-oxo-dGTP pyrophosphatase MutT (NUDIX family)